MRRSRMTARPHATSGKGFLVLPKRSIMGLRNKARQERLYLRNTRTTANYTYRYEEALSQVDVCGIPDSTAAAAFVGRKQHMYVSKV